MTESQAAGRVARNGYGRRKSTEDRRTVMEFFRVSELCHKAISERCGKNRSAWLREAVEARLRAK